MTEEIQEIERLIKQAGGLADSLIRYARKLREQSQNAPTPNQERSEGFAALLEKLMDVGACSGALSQEMEKEQNRYQRQANAKARIAVTAGTSSLQEALIELLRAEVAKKTMSQHSATEQLLKLLPSDLPASRKIEICQQVQAAFQAGDDVVSEIRPFLKGANQQQAQKHQQIRKNVPITP